LTHLPPQVLKPYSPSMPFDACSFLGLSQKRGELVTRGHNEGHFLSQPQRKLPVATLGATYLAEVRDLADTCRWLTSWSCGQSPPCLAFALLAASFDQPVPWVCFGEWSSLIGVGPGYGMSVDRGRRTLCAREDARPS